MFRGTDISYAAICTRRAWLSIHEIFITEDSDLVKEGKHLSEKSRKTGASQMQVGRNRLDNVELSGEEQIIHEYKRGRKVLKADEMQLVHYMNCLKSRSGRKVRGFLHLLSSRNSVEFFDTSERMNELRDLYKTIEQLREVDMPDPVRNRFCFHGCSFRDFCWGE